MDPALIIARVQASLAGAEITLEDLTGTKDHWRARVVWAGFAGHAPLARHRLVMAALADELKGPIHALTLEVLTPDEVAGR
jgi:stress-induced morphogen